MGKIHSLYKEAHYKKDYTDFFVYLDTESELKIDEINDEDGNSVLDSAVMNGDLIAVEKLLLKGAQPKSSSTRSPLYLAIVDNRQRVADLLLRFGADINEKNAARMTLLYWTTNRKDLSGMRYLLDHGINIHLIRAGKTALMDAITPKVYPEGVALLLEYGAGIAADFTDINDMQPAWVKAAVLIGAKKDDIPLTRETEGFAQAIFTVEQFDKAVQEEESFNFVGLHNTVTKLLREGNQDPELVRFEAYLKPLAEKAKSTQQIAKQNTQRLDTLKNQAAGKLATFFERGGTVPRKEWNKLATDVQHLVEEKRVIIRNDKK